MYGKKKKIDLLQSNINVENNDNSFGVFLKQSEFIYSSYRVPADPKPCTA